MLDDLCRFAPCSAAPDNKQTETVEDKLTGVFRRYSLRRAMRRLLSEFDIPEPVSGVDVYPMDQPLVPAFMKPEGQLLRAGATAEDAESLLDLLPGDGEDTDHSKGRSSPPSGSGNRSTPPRTLFSPDEDLKPEKYCPVRRGTRHKCLMELCRECARHEFDRPDFLEMARYIHARGVVTDDLATHLREAERMWENWLAKYEPPSGGSKKGIWEMFWSDLGERNCRFPFPVLLSVASRFAELHGFLDADGQPLFVLPERDIADYYGCSRRKVRKLLRIAKRRGLIEVVHPGGSGPGDAAVYRLCPPSGGKNAPLLPGTTEEGGARNEDVRVRFAAAGEIGPNCPGAASSEGDSGDNKRLRSPP